MRFLQLPKLNWDMVLPWSVWVFVLYCWLCYGSYGSSFSSFMISSSLGISSKKQSLLIRSIQRRITWRCSSIVNMRKMKLFKNLSLMVQFLIIMKKILSKVFRSSTVKLFITSEKNLLPIKKHRRGRLIHLREVITILSSLVLFLQGVAQECYSRISMSRI